ncbi:GINS complex subunit, partial [Linderina pennispora]
DLLVLRRAWINERNSPELYTYEGAALENLMELVDFQLQSLDAQPASIQNVIRMDADRVKYLVRSYLRTRLNKVEQHSGYVLREMKERLSQAELEYAEGFRSLQDAHVRKSFLDQFPAHLRRVDEETKDGLKMVPEPDMDRAVFCRVRTTVGQFQFDESEDPIVMKKGNIFITQYSIIRDLLRDGRVELI